MPNSDISRLAQEAIALAQRAIDPTVRANLIRAAENLKRVADDGDSVRNGQPLEFSPVGHQASAAETSPPPASL